MLEAVNLVTESRRVLLSGHLRADGDCLGAQSVVYHALKRMGKEVEVMLPNAPDGRYGFLEAHTPWTLYDGKLPEADLLIVCDCNTLRRLGEMGKAVEASGMKRLVIDHHPMEEDQGWSASVHDCGSAASGLLALDFVEALGVTDLPAEAYEAAFVALMTDTGWLKYSNANADAWAAAARLVANGVDTSRIYDLVYQQAEMGRPLGIAAVLESLEYHADGQIAIAWTSQRHLESVGGSMEDTDDVLDLLRSVRVVEAVGLLTERDGGMVKLSLRSKHHLDVNKVARRLGGGGHARAAGATFEAGTSFEDAVEQVRSELLREVED
ncbi:MAG: DHH family phosphoesterase [Planctomycetota bacterium]|nr:DHH family phosphoesterase [Planctomycetota bacterium]